MDKIFHNASTSNSFPTQAFQYFEIFLSWIFSYRSRCYQLKIKKDSKTFSNPSSKFYEFAKSYRTKKASKGIICRVTPFKEDIEKTREILQCIYEEIPSVEHSELATAEVLTKVLAYRALETEDTLSIPTVNHTGNLQMVPYVVDKVFDLWSKVHAFGLLSKKAAPILLFRGTHFSLVSEEGRASILCDLDPQGPGRALFEHSKNTIQMWLESAKKRMGPIRVMGHSLGGSCAIYTLLHHYTLLSTDPLECSYLFNPPGISEDLIKMWEKIPKQSRPTLKGIIARGDIVSKFGYLFGQMFEISLKKPLSPVRAHESILCAEPKLYLHEIDVARENCSASRKFYSKIHKCAASMIYKFGLKFLLPK